MKIQEKMKTEWRLPPENIRLSYATDLDILKEAVRRIKAFMEK